MDDLQRQVQEAIDELVGSGAERGMQVAVYRHGEQVVDAVAGAADPATGRPVTSDTPFYCYSVGKGATSTIAHLLVERGLFAADTTTEDLCDWDRMCAVIADATPWWEPGTKTGYHAYTFGYVVGEIVRRTTGKPISQVLREEVAGPLGVADELYFGMPAAELGRLAR